MKSSALIRMILSALVIIALLCILVAGIGARSHLHLPFGRTAEDFHGVAAMDTVMFDVDSVSHLEINWVAGNITIEVVDGFDEISITETNSDAKHPMVYRHDGTKLIIQDREDNHNAVTVHSAERKDLCIAVPAAWSCQELEINSASANILLRNMTVQEMEVNTASGVCDIQNCRIQELEMNGASADLFFTGSLLNLEMNGASASAVVSVNNVPQSLSMESMSGKLELTLPQDCGFRLDQNSLSGKANIDFDTRTVDGCQVYGDGACRIKIEGLSASAAIHKAEQDAQAW